MPEFKIRFERTGGNFGPQMLSYISEDGKRTIDLARLSENGAYIEETNSDVAWKFAEEALEQILLRESNKGED